MQTFPSSLMSQEPLLELPKLYRWHLQRSREGEKRLYVGVSLAPLNETDIIPVKACELGQLLLAQPTSLPTRPNSAAQAQQFGIDRHPRNVAGRTRGLYTLAVYNDK